MSKYLESCNNECKIVMLLLVVVLAYLLYQCYNKPNECAIEEGFVNQALEETRNYNAATKKKKCKRKFLGICMD